jgi:hypothetical protein
MSSIWLLILILVFLLALGAAVFIFWLLKRARRISFTADPAVKAQPDPKTPAPSEFLNYASGLELRTSFKRSLRLLKSYVTGRDYRYRVPWFLMTGESESGKTTILDANGVNLSANGSGHDEPVNWYFFNEGVVIDVAGDFVLRTDGTANHQGWNTISRLLQKHRPRRPLDGIVLTISCTDLIGTNELSNQRRFELEQKATCLYRKLWQSQRVLGMRLPVYILVTKCDEITGFTSFCNQLPEKLQTQMFGWSNPLTLDTVYDPGLLGDAFESLYRDLSYLQFEIYAEQDEIQDADDLFLFPAVAQTMRAPLQVYLDALFKQSAYHESFFFRGLYFCGESPADLSISASAPATREPDWTNVLEPFEVSLPEKIQPSEREPIFVHDLFKEKIFAEDFLAQPIRRVALSRNRTVLAAQILSLLIIVVGGVGLAVARYRLSQEQTKLYGFLVEEEKRLTRLEQLKLNQQKTDAAYRSSIDNAVREAGSDSYRRNIAYQVAFNDIVPGMPTGNSQVSGANAEEQTLPDSEAKLAEFMGKMNATKFYSVFIPSSWFSSIDETLQGSIKTAFRWLIFEALRIDLERRATKLTDRGPTPLSTFNSGFDNKDGAANDTAASPRAKFALNFQLPVYIEDLGELRLNLERYYRLIHKGSGKLDDLNQLIKYLGHKELPTNFDQENELYKLALRDAEGIEIKTGPLYQAGADRVVERIGDMYERSFNLVGFDEKYLDEITKSEELLRRPEYTWLATAICDARSPFSGMTISSALIDLKQAIVDLKHQPFMTRDLPEEGVRYQHSRGVLVWDQETLREVLKVNEEFEYFMSTKSYAPSEQLDKAARDTARARVRIKIRKLISRAQKAQPLTPSAEGLALKTALMTEMQYLQNAQPLLSRVLEISSRLGADDELRVMLREQGSYLLRGAQRLFDDGQFYVTRKNDLSLGGRVVTDFEWWDGTRPVSYRVYELNSKEDLAAYLNVQRKSIAFLARDFVVPVQTFFATQSIYLPRSRPQVDWDTILADLDAYDNKTPGNPIGALETFIRTDMDKVSLDSCYGLAQIDEQPSTDYFLSIRNSLRVGFLERCKLLAHAKAIDDTIDELRNYGEIEKSFNENLAGAFPFAQVNAPQLDPWAMLKFFKVLKEKEKAAREALNRSAEFGANPQPATDFLDQMNRAREFFAPFIEKNQGPSFDFRVQFRVNREQEIAANQIIDWKLEVGKKKFAYTSDDLTGHWIYGEPVRLTLRWANDSPSRPLAGVDPMLVTVKERSAIFEYNDRWSLFTLLLRHGLQLKRAGAPAECDQGYDADPYTLAFIVKTAPDPAAQFGQPQALNSLVAEVFLRITMLGANKPEPIMLPCLPIKAPLVPSLHPSAIRTAANKDD